MKSLRKKYGTSLFQIILIACAPLCVSIAADEPLPPQHYQQSCAGCHVRITGGEGELIYKRKDRMVNDYDALVERVRYCSKEVSPDWDADKIEAIVRYLNTRFYRFFPPEKSNKTGT